MIFYANPIKVGLDAVSSLGDGSTINIKWFQAYSNINANGIAYHIYYSENKKTVYSEGVKYISIDGSLEANIIGLTPGQLMFFSVRPVEYTPLYLENDFNITLVNNFEVILIIDDLDSQLPLVYDALREYPVSMLRTNITATDLVIPLISIDGFSNTGIIKVGVELIQYSNIDIINKNLILDELDQRGFDNTVVSLHNINGFDGYNTWSPTISFFIAGESKIFDRIFMCQSRFEYPNFPYTAVDGYRQVVKDLLNTDLTASDIDNSDFPAYDYSGYHRTDPIQLLNGTCVGSYIGGEMGCIDGYGNVNILRGFSLQDQNTQRQDVLLSITGRPAVLIKRAHTGITCSCYLASSEYQDDRCPFCFVPGTLINTKEGFRPIEEIKIGDMVLSSDGDYHKVLNNFKNNYNGKLKSIITTTTVDPILCTPEHPFLSLGGSHDHNKGCSPVYCTEFIKRGDGIGENSIKRGNINLRKNGKYWARATIKGHKRKSLGLHNTSDLAQTAIDNYLKEYQLPGHMITWKNAEDLNNKSWLVNSWYRYIYDIESISIPEEFLKKTKLGSQRNGLTTFNVDEEFLWIIGMYLAEGSTSKRTVQFSLHRQETDYQNKIINFFKKYGFTGTIIETAENGAAVEIYSTSLAQWFPKWLGHLCFNKKIPNELMSLTNEKLNSLIQGIFDGDSGKRDADLVQTSKILALQVGEILLKLGQQPNLRSRKNNILTPKGNERKMTYGVSKELSTFNRKNRKGRWQLNDKLLTKVKKITEIDYEGPVYNLEVEGDHTYVVQNVVVHNCLGSKFVIGYQQFFNPRRSDGRILVRTSPADDGVVMQEAGLESQLNLDLWTLTVPTIHQRDIIILFDVDDNEEFRYEIGMVSRNNTIVGMEGGQKFKGIRIRKTDPAYQIRVFRNTSMFPSTINTSIGFGVGIAPHSHAIQLSEKITNTNQINQMTDMVQAHSHEVVNGIVQLTLGHTHNIII